ncbi:HIT-like protein [Aspergillus sclerotiicarbonarius CBS 121057]|uniref:Bis(5'-adenosyl)-triphosphatase n=1 Tax=Aspergillus sclerotiicarbonarius (strain CBS 121057 / IBT 28362) TaxID=1448318 RepID=A0A319EDJ2_ASPSB|nr:HIT-like protein [Aspergillus sclerotiicarbonarius CBS 121057]
MSIPPSISTILKAGPIHFGPFLVTTQVFHLTPHSYALVNLKPILPGHVLISPRRVVPRVTDLTPTETSDLFLTVRRVARMIERVYGASSLNIAIQDGAEAGQSVPHVHAHVIPRRRGDLDHRGGMDAVYEMLDGEEGDLGRVFEKGDGEGEGEGVGVGGRRRFPKVDDEERKPRGMKEMEGEAWMLAREMEKEPVD